MSVESHSSSPPSACLREIVRLTEAAGGADAPEEIYDAALDAVARALGVARSAVLISDEEGAMRFAAWRGLSDEYRRAAEGHAPWPAETRDPSPILVADAALDQFLGPRRAPTLAEGVAALAFVPLVCRGRLLGALALYRDRPHAFADEELLLARAVASQVASAVGRDAAARSRAGETLRNNEEMLRRLTRNLPNGSISVFDRELRYVFAEGRGLAQAGLAAESLVGRTLYELFPPEQVERVSGHYEAAFAGRTVEFELEVGEHWYAVTAAPLYDEGGEVYAVIAASQNVTARKLAEEGLRRTTQTVEALIRACPLAVMSLDAGGRVTMWNPAAERVYGWKAEEVLGRTLPTVPEEERAEFDANTEDALSRGRSFTAFETRRRRKDGTLVDVSISTSLLREEGGEISGLVAVVEDISERKRTENFLAAQRRSLELIARGAPLRGLLDSIAQTVDELSGGAAVAEILLVDHENRRLRRGAGPGLPDEYHDAVDGLAYGPRVGTCGVVAATGRVVVTTDIEADAHWEDLKHLPLGLGLRAAWSMPVFSGDGRVLATFGTYFREKRGPTEWERRLVEVLSHTTALALERKAEEEARERLLASEQAARRDAEEVSRVKDEFLATVSHELRTPLTAVIGWTHLMRTGEVKGEAAERALVVVERNANAQVQLIDDLLDVSRIVTGKLQLDARRLDLNAPVDAAVEALRPAAAAKGVRLSKEADGPAGLVSGDAARLQQVVWNLLSNAVKFTPEGGEVRVCVWSTRAQAGVSVTDTGQGIEPDFLPYVFDRFRQADGSTTRRHGGLGLGLSIVRHLVEAHGGSVRAESAGGGGGSTFTVSLPRLHARGAAGGEDEGEGGGTGRPKASTGVGAHAPAPDGDGLGPDGIRLDGLRVLVVDDEGDARDFLSSVFAARGAEVARARSVAEAFDLLKATRPDVLVSDIGMPDEDGYSLIARTRALPLEQGGGTPAVALTAYARDEDRLRAIRAGFQTHLSKPVSVADLVAVVARLAGRA